MLELKNDLVNIDSSEFSYFDNVMMETRVCPEEAEVEIPTYYRRERELQIKVSFINIFFLCSGMI